MDIQVGKWLQFDSHHWIFVNDFVYMNRGSSSCTSDTGCRLMTFMKVECFGDSFCLRQKKIYIYIYNHIKSCWSWGFFRILGGWGKGRVDRRFLPATKNLIQDMFLPKTSWWFERFVLFTPNPGEHIFQMGWNHKLNPQEIFTIPYHPIWAMRFNGPKRLVRRDLLGMKKLSSYMGMIFMSNINIFWIPKINWIV